jgi:hypothetical protein
MSRFPRTGRLIGALALLLTIPGARSAQVASVEDLTRRVDVGDHTAYGTKTPVTR